MYCRKFILILGAFILLSGCKSNNLTPQPTATIAPSVAPIESPQPSASANTSSVQGSLKNITPTSVQVEVNNNLQDYPAISKVKQDADQLKINIDDTVILNLKGSTVQSIEKVLTK